ncbi:TetR/AcrR family transcriptional regulator [Amycolatopsis sp. NPDC059021]|uniref:TetR/AcrR family transcriptional regulator n=1 Tax=Amycolatopsis sp. NPDC059021 TaxID=3346704 RepID=UPI0036727D43
MSSQPPSSPKRGRPARLSREAIAAAALELDVETLSMNAVADRLGVAKSSLYGWVSSREELLGLVSDAVIERCLPAEDPVDGDWRSWLAQLARSMRREILTVPGYALRLSGTHQHYSDAFDRLRDKVIAVFRQAGLARGPATQSWYVFSTAMVGWLALEHQHTTERPAPRFESFLAVLLRGLPAS